MGAGLRHAWPRRHRFVHGGAGASPPPPTPTGISTCSATCSRKSAPTMSRSPTSRSSSRRRSTACSPRSIRIRATWTPRASRTCRFRRAASSAALASRSRRKTGWSRSSRRSTTRRPRARAILSGDIITAIDDENVQGLTLNQAVDKMRGAVNTPVKLTILRGTNKDQIDVKLTRAVIQIKSVRSQSRRRRYRLYPHHPVQRADLRRPARRDPEDSRRTSRPTSSRAISSTCATIPAACSISRSRSSTAFLDRGEIVSTRGRNAEETHALQRRSPAICRRASPWSS